MNKDIKEVVAKAIYEEDNCNRAGYYWSSEAPNIRIIYRQMAQAAIAAIQEAETELLKDNSSLSAKNHSDFIARLPSVEELENIIEFEQRESQSAGLNRRIAKAIAERIGGKTK